MLACWYHHHWLHEQHWSIQPLGAGHFILVDPDGNTHPLKPPLIGLTLPPALPFEPLDDLGSQPIPDDRAAH